MSACCRAVGSSLENRRGFTQESDGGSRGRVDRVCSNGVPGATVPVTTTTGRSVFETCVKNGDRCFPSRSPLCHHFKQVTGGFAS